jgi:hypothetical protein
LVPALKTNGNQNEGNDKVPAMEDHALNHLDDGIRQAVLVLRQHGIETFESCEGGDGHAFLEPTIRFHGHKSEGFRALAAALEAGLRVSELRRVWPILDGEPTGPCWELTLTASTGS